MQEKIKRYAIFLIGLFINSLGVSFITKADLGTSPISSIPYVLSLKFSWTLGEFTIIFNVFIVLLQLILLRKKFKLEYWIQIPVTFLFGYFIDLTMVFLDFMNPQQYILKILALLVGCLILGFGVYIEVLADVVMLPGESFVRAVVLTWKTNFGNTKVAFDASMSVAAAVLSLIFFHRLNGVREGTIIAALLVGFIARLFGRLSAPIKPLLFPEKTENQSASNLRNNEIQPNVVAIARQYGCRGHEIGQLLAKKLGYEFYDREIIKMIAGTTGYSTAYIKEREEKMTNSFLFDLVNQMYAYTSEDKAPKDKIFEAESNAIRKLAKTKNCVIIGRCSDYILKDNDHCLKVYLYSDLNERICYLSAKKQITDTEAGKQIVAEDKARSDNYRYYTRQLWGFAPDYDLNINTAFGVEYAVDLIIDGMKRKKII